MFILILPPYSGLEAWERKGPGRNDLETLQTKFERQRTSEDVWSLRKSVMPSEAPGHPSHAPPKWVLRPKHSFQGPQD